jgi:uncharacterized protein YndB with AHSA1/START domain
LQRQTQELAVSLSRFAIAALLLSFAGNVFAEVKDSTADGFFVSFSEPVAANPAKAYTDITQVQRWWSSDHTWSGSAANLTLKPEAGGCFCERWKSGSAEHGHVIMALPGKLLRLETALGPLQEFALKGILSFWIRSEDDGTTTMSVEYRVNGASASGLDKLAPSVDEVLGAQVARLKRYIGTGDPEAPVADAQKDTDKDADKDSAKSADAAAPKPPAAKNKKPKADAKGKP